MMKNELLSRETILWSVGIVLLVAGFVFWAHTDQLSLKEFALEDGPLENLSAICFGLSAIGFVVMLRRSTLLREASGWWRYWAVAGWAALMFVFVGEEISWGQRIFGFDTPESLQETNVQNEFNLHNLDFMVGFKYRALSLMMLITGVILPGLALFGFGRRLIQRVCFPVLPICYAGFFITAYLFGRQYAYLPNDSGTEIREFLMSLGLAAFGIHGAIKPDDLFRVSRD